MTSKEKLPESSEKLIKRSDPEVNRQRLAEIALQRPLTKAEEVYARYLNRRLSQTENEKDVP